MAFGVILERILQVALMAAWHDGRVPPVLAAVVQCYNDVHRAAEEAVPLLVPAKPVWESVPAAMYPGGLARPALHD